MSGAAGIAAAKNRRSKADPNQKPTTTISCGSKTGGCPMPINTKAQSLQKAQLARGGSVFDEDSLQITGPMPLLQVLKVHEQRLNKIDEKLSKVQGGASQVGVSQVGASVSQVDVSACGQTSAGCDEECYERISSLEEKIHMLEEVIMNLQLTVTNVQSFAMETSLAMMKLQKQIPVIEPVVATA
jgi:hypothetical protein